MSLILEELSTNGAVGVAEIAAKLDVSTASIRRDLQTLEEQRLLTRTHGGAVANSTVYELPLRYRGGRHREEKRRIALAAAARVGAEVASVGLTGGTTTTEVARELAGRQDLTVVTNALNIASELALRRNLKLFVTGGIARAESYELIGPVAEASLGGFNLDVVFVGVNGISARGGVTTHEEDDARTVAALIGHAQTVIVVTERAKLGKVTFARICDIDRVDELVTDGESDETELAAIAATGVHVTLV